MRAWLIDPLSRPIVRAVSFSDDVKAQAGELLHQLQNYDEPKIVRRLFNGDVLLVSEETWKATGWFFRFKEEEFFGRGIICGPPADPANPVFTSARSTTLIQLLDAAGRISWGKRRPRADA